MIWTISCLAGGCFLVVAAATDRASASPPTPMRWVATCLLAVGGLVLLREGRPVPALVVGTGSLLLMLPWRRPPGARATPPGWFVVPGLLVVGGAVAWLAGATDGRRGEVPTDAPRIVFDQGAAAGEATVLLDDASSGLRLLESRGLPEALRAAAAAGRTEEVRELEAIRATLPELEERIRELRERLANSGATGSVPEASRAISQRVEALARLVESR